jgi:hypothetical protein
MYERSICNLVKKSFLLGRMKGTNRITNYWSSYVPYINSMYVSIRIFKFANKRHIGIYIFKLYSLLYITACVHSILNG